MFGTVLAKHGAACKRLVELVVGSESGSQPQKCESVVVADVDGGQLELAIVSTWIP